MNDVLMSIKPKYVEMLLSGQKTVEIRRRSTRLAPGTRIWIYATSPCSEIVATATVVSVHWASPDEIWQHHGANVGIDRSEFDAYISGRDKISAIALEHVRKLETPLALRNDWCGFHPPQSYANLRRGAPLLAALQTR